MKNQMNFIDLAIPTAIMGVVMIFMIAAISFSGNLMSSPLLSLSFAGQNGLERAAAPASGVISGTPQFVNNALEAQYAPVSAALSGTPQFVNNALEQQYAPISVAAVTNGTPQFVNSELAAQYAPAFNTGTPDFVNAALQAQYAAN